MRGKKPFMFQSRDTGSVDSRRKKINFLKLAIVGRVMVITWDEMKEKLMEDFFAL